MADRKEAVEHTPIPGMLVVRTPLHEDARGWFKEGWQRERMVALGLPDFGPVQQNVSFNIRRGVTRGIHTEPWDKLVSVTTGRAFAAWVDMREGASFGARFHLELDPGVAVFVPRGVGNSYQALEDATAYSYLVNDHWRHGTAYPALDLGDPTAAIPWPIPLGEAELSAKDRGNPRLGDVTPIPAKRVLIIGASGQLGRALGEVFPEADTAAIDDLDVGDAGAVEAWPWPDYALVLNASGYTAVDTAETPEGRLEAWAANAHGPAALAAAASRHRMTLVHYSTDYVFDGRQQVHTEDEPFSPLGVYGQSKAAGDLAASSTARRYLLRTSWVVGAGANFVATMRSLAERGVSPSVVADQRGRLTFASELARATRHLLDVEAPYGTYNVTNSGPTMSWADVARRVFELSGRDPADVTPTTTEEYAAGRQLAPRPANSTLDLAKLEATGFHPEDADAALVSYVTQQLEAAAGP